MSGALTVFVGRIQLVDNSISSVWNQRSTVAEPGYADWQQLAEPGCKGPDDCLVGIGKIGYGGTGTNAPLADGQPREVLIAKHQGIVRYEASRVPKSFGSVL